MNEITCPQCMTVWPAMAVSAMTAQLNRGLLLAGLDDRALYTWASVKQSFDTVGCPALGDPHVTGFRGRLSDLVR